MASAERGLMGNYLFIIAMECPCHTSFEHFTVASTELYWAEGISCLALLNDCYFLKCPKNVEPDLELYLSVIEIQEIKIRQK